MSDADLAASVAVDMTTRGTPFACYGVFTPYTDWPDCAMVVSDSRLSLEWSTTAERPRCVRLDSMRQKLTGLSQRYVTALRKHLEQGPRASFLPALDLGRRAVALGLETLDLARIHERAVTTLDLAGKRDGFIQRAQFFFTEAITPIEETHHAARKARTHLDQLTEMLGRRTVELAATNSQLQRGIVRRKTVETALKRSGERYAKLLKDSLQLQEGLRQLTHQVLAAQEDERQKFSHELQDEIAQTLLGINVRLLSLKEGVRSNTRGLENEIAGTQRLVARSARSVRQAARKFRNP